MLQSCPTLFYPIDHNLPDSSVHGILPGKNTGVDSLYDPPPRVMDIKTKVNTWDLIKLKSFCTAKKTISKVKGQLSEWEKIIANETTDKGLISKIHRLLIQLRARKTNNPIKKW